MEQEPKYNPNDETVKTYTDHFDRYVERTVSESGGEVVVWLDSFTNKLSPHSKILEIGSAGGRDARYFRDKGFDVTCTDVIPQAVECLTQEGFTAELYDFRNSPKQEWADMFDGYFANGVFVHASNEIFEKNLEYISQLVHKDGIIALSFKTGEGEEVTNDKMDAPRYFNYYNEKDTRVMFAKYGFEVLDLVYTQNDKWMRFVLKNKKNI